MATILVLDDEPDAVVLIQRILKRKGHQVFAFTEEEEAITFARSCPVDLAILDIKLKKMSGVQVLEELKKLSPAMHAMMLTGFPNVETARKAIELGADQYCLKPIELSELEEKVLSILGSTARNKD